MSAIPSDPWPDATLPLLRDPYRYVSRRARGLGADAFRSRVLGRRVVAMTGPEAAEVFYREGLFTRRDAVPARVREVLFGPEGVIQGTGGPRHLGRKRMILAMMSEASFADLGARFDAMVEGLVPVWTEADAVPVYEETRDAVAMAVCGWAGVALPGPEVRARAEQMAAMYHGAASVGPAYWRAQRGREACEAWVIGTLRAIRARGAPEGPEPTPAERLALHEEDGAPLPERVAASDLLSILRPTVAVSVWMAHLTRALHRHPEHRDAVASDAERRRAFVQEVRRHAPFFPMVAAVAARDVPWRGDVIEEGTRVLLDVWGTGRDARSWEAPDEFRPERFLGWPGDPFAMIPQGGGDHEVNHRCAGEWIAIDLMERWAHWLAGRLRWEVLTPAPAPDYRAVPALPPGLMLGSVRAA